MKVRCKNPNCPTADPSQECYRMDPEVESNHVLCYFCGACIKCGTVGESTRIKDDQGIFLKCNKCGRNNRSNNDKPHLVIWDGWMEIGPPKPDTPRLECVYPKEDSRFVLWLDFDVFPNGIVLGRANFFRWLATAIDARFIKREHFKIHKADNKFFIVDICARNGTLLGRRQLNSSKAPLEIKKGMKITLTKSRKVVVMRFMTGQNVIARERIRTGGSYYQF